MSRFQEEVRIIPRVAWLIACLFYAAVVALLVLLPFRDSNWPLWGKALFAGIVPIPMFIWVLLIGYVNADARRRGMRYVLWTLLSIFIPNGIGIILYFVLRDPLLARCHSCGTLTRTGHAFCHACGTPLGRACPQCQRLVEEGWSHCVGCGAKL